MEFKTLAEIVRYVESALALKFYSGSGVLRKSAIKIVASVIGGALYMLSLLAKHIWKNRFVSTCDVSALDGFGVEYGLPHKAATFARGRVDVALASGSSSATVPSDTMFIDSISGKYYKSIGSTSISSSSKSVVVIALEAGSDSNAAAGVVLQFADSTPAGLEDDVTVDSAGLNYGHGVYVEIDGNIELWGENAEEYRSRLLQRVQNPPQGGSENDYKMWAERFDYVTNAYIIPNTPNINSVCVVLANYNTSNVALTTAQVNEVKAYIQAPDRRPITADVRVFSATLARFAVAAYMTPWNEEVVESAKSALTDYLRSIKPGNSVFFYDAENAVLANSLAKTFDIFRVTKNGSQVSNFTLILNGSSGVGEVSDVTQLFVNGEAL